MPATGVVPTLALVSVLVTVLLGWTGCHRSASVTAPHDGTASPMNERDRMRAEAWDSATRGIDFDGHDGLVEVERIFSGDSIRAAEHLATADELFAANRVIDALEQYGLAARQDPDLADAYVGIGRVVMSKSKYDLALKSFRTAIDRDEDHLTARYQLAMALWKAGDRQGAIDEMTDLLDLDEEHAGAHERLAVWSYYTGEYAEAWQHLHRAAALGKPVPAQLPSLLERQLPDPTP
jgi:tetratricopeptide (TPR) repeat protein